MSTEPDRGSAVRSAAGGDSVVGADGRGSAVPSAAGGDSVVGADGRGSAVPSAAQTEWEGHARWWQEKFTDGVDPEYTEQIIPIVMEHLAGRERVLDIGTGEGQIARALAQAGAEVVGLDPTMAQVCTAHERAGGPVYALAQSDRLPVSSGSFDGGGVCLVYEHIDTLEESLAEVARALRPGGRLVLILNHPLFQTPNSGLIVDHMIDPPETYWRVGAYLHETATVEEVNKGVHVRFVHRPLSRYVNGMIAAGIDLVAMLEPSPPPGFVAKVPEHETDVLVNTPRLLALIGDRRQSAG
ncbi:MAG: methyltransferase domain-containing protein [Acidimicrobiaceae bacterium]|nr:methyltransferase domain-containing protein [Acidimicrobiaceae bacterium]